MEDSLIFEGNDLPVEIVITIFEYLSIKDIKNASITCKNWFNASMDSTVMDRRVLSYEINDNLKRENFKIRKPILSYNSVKIEYTITYDTADYNKPEKLRVLFEFLNQVKNLTSLNIIFLQKSFSSRCWYKSSYMSQKFGIQLKSVKVFKIKLPFFAKSCYLPYFFDLMPELEHIDITSLKQCKSCTGKSLYNYLSNGKNRIKTFGLHYTMYAEEATTIELISPMEGMNLTTLTISKRSIDPYSNFTDPNKLLHLSLTQNLNADLIANTFPNLETLSIFKCDETKGFTKLKKLKVLVCNQFSDNLIKTLSEYKFNVLERLILNAQRNLTTPVSIKNLTTLTHISLYEVVLTDPQMQEVFQHLKLLRHFALARVYSYCLTDFGFTGEKENSESGYSISNLKHLKLLHIDIGYSSLGDPTLLHIMKIRQLEYLYITCEEDRVMDLNKSINDLKERCPLLSKRAEIYVLRTKYSSERLPTMLPFNKLYPLTHFIDPNSNSNK